MYFFVFIFRTTDWQRSGCNRTKYPCEYVLRLAAAALIPYERRTGVNKEPTVTASVIYWHLCFYCEPVSSMRRAVTPSAGPTVTLSHSTNSRFLFLCNADLLFPCAATLRLWISVMHCQVHSLFFFFFNLGSSARINKTLAATRCMMVVSCPCQSLWEYSLDVNAGLALIDADSMLPERCSDMPRSHFSSIVVTESAMISTTPYNSSRLCEAITVLARPH